MTFISADIKNNILNSTGVPVVIYNANGTTLDISDNNLTTNKASSHTYDVYSEVTIENIFFNHNKILNTQAAFFSVNLTATAYIEFTNNFLKSFQQEGGAALTAADILFVNNKQISCAGAVSLTGRYYHTMFGNGNVITWGTAAPTTGTWAKGDICVNTSKTVGQPKSWSCTVAGEPGTWVSEGNL